MKILLVDDDTQMAQLVERQLEQHNYIVELASNGETAIDLLQLNPYSLVLLDVVLPNLSGIEVCQTLRDQGNQTPILMLTGQDHTTDKIIGLDAGADDYLVKPFELDELTARVRALLRRSSEVSSSVLRYGDLQFDPGTQQLTYAGSPISLRPKELAILELMLRHPTRIFKPETLLNQLWHLADCPGKATIKSHIRSLRKQLQAVGADNMIETLYGRGYRLNPAFLEKDSNSSQEASYQSLAQPLPVSTTQFSTTQSVVSQTWGQIQGISWNRLMQLQGLVRSLSLTPPCPTSQLGSRHAKDEKANDKIAKSDCWNEATTIAHQLKGTLGTFGFQSASSCAQQIEKQLAELSSRSYSLADEKVLVDDIRQRVDGLQNILQELVTDQALLYPQQSATDQIAQFALIISRDTEWQEQLQQSIQDVSFPVQGCSPSTVNAYLLEHSPTVIVLEITIANREVDLSLLDALVSNYRKQVPILTIIESQQQDDQCLALEHGATAIVLKIWSLKTLISILNEYTIAEVTQCND